MSTPLCQELGIELPIFAFSHCRDVVAAVSRAGGLGVLGAASMAVDDLERDLGILDRECGDAPYGVDVMFPAESKPVDEAKISELIPAEHRTFVEALDREFGVPAAEASGQKSTIKGVPNELEFLPTRSAARRRWEIARDHRVSLVASALGPLPADIATDAKRRSIRVAGLVGDPKHVPRHVDGGADLLIAQGSESAGHTGTISTMVLVPQVVRQAGSVPVLAAGGIGSGQQVVAALALGAQGAWLGSIWLTTLESDLDEIVIDKLLAAESRDTLMTRCMTGKPTRQLSTAWVQAWGRLEAPDPLPSPAQQVLIRDSLVSAFDHRVSPVMGTTCGQVVGMITQRRSVRAVMQQLVEEMLDAFGAIRGAHELLSS